MPDDNHVKPDAEPASVAPVRVQRGVVLHAMQELIIRRAKAEQQACDCYVAKQYELTEGWRCRAAGLGEAVEVLQRYAEEMQDNVDLSHAANKKGQSC